MMELRAVGFCEAVLLRMPAPEGAEAIVAVSSAPQGEAVCRITWFADKTQNKNTSAISLVTRFQDGEHIVTSTANAGQDYPEGCRVATAESSSATALWRLHCRRCTSKAASAQPVLLKTYRDLFNESAKASKIEPPVSLASEPPPPVEPKIETPPEESPMMSALELKLSNPELVFAPANFASSPTPAEVPEALTPSPQPPVVAMPEVSWVSVSEAPKATPAPEPEPLFKPADVTPPPLPAAVATEWGAPPSEANATVIAPTEIPPEVAPTEEFVRNLARGPRPMPLQFKSTDSKPMIPAARKAEPIKPAADQGNKPSESKKPSFLKRALKLVCLLLALATAAGASTLYLKPELRGRATAAFDTVELPAWANDLVRRVVRATK